jgi:hypothetical protein
MIKINACITLDSVEAACSDPSVTRTYFIAADEVVWDFPPSCAGPLPDDERQTMLKWFLCKAPPGPVQPVDAGSAHSDGGDP